MHQNHVAVLHPLHHAGHDALHVVVLPVLRVHRPQNNRPVRPGPYSLVHKAVGRPQPVVSLPQNLPQKGAGLADLQVKIGLAQSGHIHVVIGVHPNLAPLVLHLTDELLVARDSVAHHKKGGGHFPQLQLLQQPAGGIRPGSVVKGEGHHRHLHLSLSLRALHRLPHRGQRQNKTHHQKAQPHARSLSSPHAAPSFCFLQQEVYELFFVFFGAMIANFPVFGIKNPGEHPPRDRIKGFTLSGPRYRRWSWRLRPDQPDPGSRWE